MAVTPIGSTDQPMVVEGEPPDDLRSSRYSARILRRKLFIFKAAGAATVPLTIAISRDAFGRDRGIRLEFGTANLFALAQSSIRPQDRLRKTSSD
jgi:hypothetical protein